MGPRPFRIRRTRLWRHAAPVAAGAALLVHLTTGIAPAQAAPDAPEPAPTLPGWTASACHGLGWLVAPVLWPLGGGTFTPDGWAARPGLCATLVTEAGLAALSAPVSVAAPNGTPVFGAGSFDTFFRDALRSRSSVDNFLDGTMGDLYLPLVTTGLLLAVPAVDQGLPAYRDAVGRALPLLWFGIGGNQLFVTASKKAFGRERPYLKYDNAAAINEFGTGDDAHESFYSGHATTAFFAAAFTDRVLAETLAHTHPDYCLGCDAPWPGPLLRVGQAALLYGLAAYVGYSRIEIDKHYMTDVLVGAGIGALHGQLIYAFGYRADGPSTVHTVVGPGTLALRWHF